MERAANTEFINSAVPEYPGIHKNTFSRKEKNLPTSAANPLYQDPFFEDEPPEEAIW